MKIWTDDNTNFLKNIYIYLIKSISKYSNNLKTINLPRFTYMFPKFQKTQFIISLTLGRIRKRMVRNFRNVGKWWRRWRWKHWVGIDSLRWYVFCKKLSIKSELDRQSRFRRNKSRWRHHSWWVKKLKFLKNIYFTDDYDKLIKIFRRANIIKDGAGRHQTHRNSFKGEDFINFIMREHSVSKSIF